MQIILRFERKKVIKLHLLLFHAIRWLVLFLLLEWDFVLDILLISERFAPVHE